MPKSKHQRYSEIQTFLSSKTSDTNAPPTPAEVISVGTIDPASFQPAFYGDSRKLLSTGTRMDLIEPTECPIFQKGWPKQMGNIASVVSQLCRQSVVEKFVTPDRLRLSGHPIDASILALPSTNRHSVKPIVLQDPEDEDLSVEKALKRLPGAVVAATFDIHYRGAHGVHEFNNCITKIVIIQDAPVGAGKM